MLVSGEFIDADTALEQGLLSAVTNDSDVDAAVADKVEQILSKSPRRGALWKVDVPSPA